MKSYLYILPVVAFVALWGCSKSGSQLKVEPASVIVYSEGTQQLTSNAPDAVYTTADEFYASVSETGLVTGNKIGGTTIQVTSSIGSAMIPVIIMHRYSLYPDVDGLVGGNISEAILLLGDNYDSRTGDDGSIAYYFENPTKYCPVIMVITKNSVIDSVSVIVSTEYSSMLADHLSERYYVAGMQNEYYFFLNHDKDVLIGLSLYSTEYWMAMYIENTSAKSINQLDIDRYKEYISLFGR